MIIRSRAPVRISFGGGGTDLSPYCEKFGGAVLNTTINKYVYVTLLPQPDRSAIKIISADYKKTFAFKDLDHVFFNGDIDLIKACILRMRPAYGFDLYLRSDIPPNTGLGSSAAVTTALIGAFNHLRNDNKLNSYEIAELSFTIETEDIKNVSGRQDQYASAFGGLNYIEFHNGSFVRVVPLDISQDYLYELEKHLVLAFIEPRGPSGDIQQIMTDTQINGSASAVKQKTTLLHELKSLCRSMQLSLVNGELDNFGQLLDLAWTKKRQLSPSISTVKSDALYEIAKLSGALGGKITGAGGGGCMIFFCASNQEQEVSKALTKHGARVIDFSFDQQGLTTWQLNRSHRKDSIVNDTLSVPTAVAKNA